MSTKEKVRYLYHKVQGLLASETLSEDEMGKVQVYCEEMNELLSSINVIDIMEIINEADSNYAY